MCSDAQQVHHQCKVQLKALTKVALEELAEAAARHLRLVAPVHLCRDKIQQRSGALDGQQRGGSTLGKGDTPQHNQRRHAAA